jgi:dCTP deaminase
MILGNLAILNTVKECVAPFRPDHVGPASYDITLASSFAWPGKAAWTNPEGIDLLPGDFVLACTLETITIPNNVAVMVCNRSSVGRTGLFIENAGFVDPGFEGQITLEMYNASKECLHLYPGQRVGQLVFFGVQDCTVGYGDRDGSKYQGQKGATCSRLWMDRENMRNELY